jgi:hypothetical protein
MKSIPWSKPKYLIIKFLDFISVISIISAILAVIFFALWKNGLPLTSIDFSLPSYYSDKIHNLQKTIKNSTTEKAKLKGYEHLLEALKDSTFLNKYYPLVEESNQFIIDYMLSQNQLKKAENFAYKWQEKYSYDFNAKFKYVEILKISNPKKAIEYFENVYFKYKDIELVISKFIDVLLDVGEFDRALKVALESSENVISKITPDFMFSIKDSNNKKNTLDFHPVLKEEFRISDDGFNIQVHKNINNLKEIKFNISKFKVRTKINRLTITIKTQNQSYNNIKFKPIKHIKNINQKYQVTGDNPELEIQLPIELYDFSGEVEINVQIKMDHNQNLELNKILLNPQWKVNYSINQKFQKFNKFNFIINKNEKNYSSSLPTINTQIKYLKLEFPSFQNLSVKNLEFHNAHKNKLNFKIIKKQNLIVVNDANLLVKGTKPYLILELFEPMILTNITMNFDIGNHDI